MQLIEEKRLIKTMLSQRPSADAKWAAALATLIMTVATLLFWRFDLAWTAEFDSVFKNLQLWRLATSVLIHADIGHLLSNLLMFWIFSYFIFGYFGFAVFPVITFGLAVAVNAVVVLTYAPGVELLGASGWVYILGGFWLAEYFLIQRQYSVANRLMRVTGIALVIFVPSTLVATTSYRAHAIGFATGVLAAVAYFLKHKKNIRDQEVYKTTVIEDIINPL